MFGRGGHRLRHLDRRRISSDEWRLLVWDRWEWRLPVYREDGDALQSISFQLESWPYWQADAGEYFFITQEARVFRFYGKKIE
jgi:hypothetical protein